MEPLEKMKHGKKWITSVLYDSVCITVMCMNDVRLYKKTGQIHRNTRIFAINQYQEAVISLQGDTHTHTEKNLYNPHSL